MANATLKSVMKAPFNIMTAASDICIEDMLDLLAANRLPARTDESEIGPALIEPSIANRADATW
ncbi:hypothetical protein [Sphingobium phenoxybenzoativorans]|uniref:hypothetical protein n=1 Tax=Sphingobium phenoxybenzoativorans TaxID=1592790 RepID=UPI0014959721